MSMNTSTSNLSDVSNIAYQANITMNGELFSVVIDTGSSDLILTNEVPGAVDEHYNETVTFAVGGNTGEVRSGTMEIEDFRIESQYFIDATGQQFPGGADGLVGLGPSSGSQVRAGGNSASANPFLDQIFLSNDTVENYIAVLLGRSNDPDDPYPGDLSIGDVLPELNDILNTTKHSVTTSGIKFSQHWQILLDENGIIGPNGKPIPITSQVTNTTNPKNATVVFDTGFSLPQVPRYIADALYADIPGTELKNLSGVGEIYFLPCDYEMNATFLFGGIEFPIHPLDLNFYSPGLGTSNCVGGFQPFSYDQGEVLYDMVLGMGFLRNAYLLVNFGNLLNASTPETTTAYIQLLPTTNATEAAADFAQVRKSGKKPKSSSSDKGTDDLESLVNNATTSSQKKKNSKGGSWVAAVIAVGVVVLFLLVLLGLWWWGRRNRSKSKSTNVGEAGSIPAYPSNDATQYRLLDEPSPQGAYDLQIAPDGAYTEPKLYGTEYKTAWDAHV
ncbi:hypothetical protein HYDPIDRAFT_114175 [Hydnomerulius pinastri MD-312]|uniref:Peptidase A1 domain-containing protein n=1 Tax=Hydnomerulius pinastri MD-312 TaxID=994086 RepID=A0A0C9WDJ2_9AGAM|nr:hypothetical protein HYDPIDRAFT_114175 [Hydnomerulius pinastri MD-312]